jgi:molybdopterin converting factor small subunit
MINVSVLFFGATAEAVGTKEIELNLNDETKSDEVFAKVLDNFPQLRQNFNKSLLFAVNQEYADGGEIIKNGDELAIFTAVSGG